MKALFLLKIPPPYGGGEIVNAYLYEKLKDKYNFITIKRNDHSKSDQGLLTASNTFSSLKIIWQTFIYILTKKPDKLFLGISKDKFAFIRDSIIIHFAWLFNVKVIGDLHGMSFTFQEEKLMKRILLKTLNKVYSIRVLSKSIKTNLLDLGYKGNLFVVDNGIKREWKHKDYNEEILSTLNLLYLGAISESKGFLHVLNLLIELNKTKEARVKLNVIGGWKSAEFKNYCQKKISLNQLNDIIVFHGILVDEKKWIKIMENNILLHFSNWDGQPLTIIECMSVGIPTIATKIGAIPEMITDKVNGFLIEDPITDGKIIIKDLLKNKNIILEEISKNCITTYESRFTIDRYVKSIEDLIRN